MIWYLLHKCYIQLKNAIENTNLLVNVKIKNCIQNQKIRMRKTSLTPSGHSTKGGFLKFWASSYDINFEYEFLSFFYRRRELQKFPRNFYFFALNIGKEIYGTQSNFSYY